MTNLTTLQTVANRANHHYWEAHALLMAATMMAEKLDEDEEWVLELRSLLTMASMKVLDIQVCFDPYVQAKGRG